MRKGLSRNLQGRKRTLRVVSVRGGVESPRKAREEAKVFEPREAIEAAIKPLHDSARMSVTYCLHHLLDSAEWHRQRYAKAAKLAMLRNYTDVLNHLAYRDSASYALYVVHLLVAIDTYAYKLDRAVEAKLNHLPTLEGE